MTTNIAGQGQTFEFQAETRKILDLMIHSIYSNKDVFLRELISNASDALDRLRLETLMHPDLAEETSNQKPEIRLILDKQDRKLTVEDNGIGMDESDLVRFIGTIASSGTKAFEEALSGDKEALSNMIGQFGVGFYSCFMVADRVRIETRKIGDEKSWVWESEGNGFYTLKEGDLRPYGTAVTLYLKDPNPETGIIDYASEEILRGLVKKYSDFGTYPIRLGNETLNSMKALWTRVEEEVSEEEYEEFYRHMSRDWEKPLKRILYHAEGTCEFRALLFIPSHAQVNLFLPETSYGIQLYIRRVFIRNDCTDLIPPFLRFIRGVVDSEDLPLNVSREVLQQNRLTPLIRNNLTRKVLETLSSMKKEDPSLYQTFWKEFGAILKEGLLTEEHTKELLLDLCLFGSSTQNGLTTLEAYVSRMKEGQDRIYYLLAPSQASALSSPHLEGFKARGIEVLLLSDPIDEFIVQRIQDYRGHPFESAAVKDVTLPESQTPSAEGQERGEHRFAPFLTTVRGLLEPYVKEVRLSKRLTESPVCLVSDPSDPSPQLEELMRGLGQDVPRIKRILEFNPNHSIFQKFFALYEKNPEDPSIGELAHLLYGVAALSCGEKLEDPGDYSRRISKLIDLVL